MKYRHRKPITQISRRITLLVVCSILVVGMLIARAAQPSNQLNLVIAKSVEMPALTQFGKLNEQQLEQSHTTSIQNINIWNYGMAMGVQHERHSQTNRQTVSPGETLSKTSVSSNAHKAAVDQQRDEQPMISVWLTEQQIVERVPLEQYVLQVTLAEIPSSFEEEAIKAQMLAVRTYIVRRMINASNLVQYDQSGESYIVTDTVQHQVYWSNEHMLKYETDEHNKQTLEKFTRALEATKGQILIYNEEPIEAVFFSTSNGYTEAAEDYWGHAIDYLQSVESKWDQSISPSYEKELAFSYEQLYQLLGLAVTDNDTLSISNVTRTNSNRIASLSINGEIIEGKQFRELLGLASTHFTWTQDKKARTMTFTTYGYGHGVGMSQWGANGMAQAGYLANDIVTHYYKGVHIEQASKLVNNY